MTSPTPIESDRADDGSPHVDGKRWDVADLAFCVFYLFLAVWLTSYLWPDPGAKVMALNPADQTLYEWFLAYDTRIARGDVGLITDRLNVPDGVNLLANTSVIALGVLMTPVTLVFGVPVTFAVLVVLNLAGTAIAWHVLFRRVLGAEPVAAGLGAVFAGFAPGMVSQSVSHLHMTAQWLVPVMVWMLVRMYRAAGARDRRRVGTSALGLAAAVVVQVFIGEEVLFLTACTLLLVTVGYAVLHPRAARRAAGLFTAGMLVTAAVSGALLAYPLWVQFAGPQAVNGTLFLPGYFVTDLASFAAFSPLSVAGGPASAELSTGPSEYNTFLGWPLLLLTAGFVIWRRRDRAVLAAAFAGLVMAVLSLGPSIVYDREQLDVWGPFSLLESVPVVDAALPMRFSLPLIPVIAVILARGIQHGLSRPDLTRYVAPVLTVVALAPLTPEPLPAATREPLPEFIAGGHWRECVPVGGVLVPVPLPTPQDPWPMRWAAATNTAFGMPEGFFIASYGADGAPSMGTYQRTLSNVTAEVAKTGAVPEIDAQKGADARADLAHWGASCVVVADSAPNAAALRITVGRLLGTPGTRLADVYYWRA
ncbi:hypothetical protein [Catenuloplanes atrovinosus]|uniref:DUF6311 domain-containing protein n=1 Tax=Catenuloplanes atrovinosus TaxID=137266 RepID=A0AAE4CCL2_9ACTN|nr:hypothetical protein [Catenuloplanes atrovinosus]MDR7279298.1 hypothetical protein [Catenuloplanes atrovinosus]